MKKVRLIAAALGAAALVALPQAASAAIWTTTYQGVVTAGSDIGTFGMGCFPCSGGGELNGLAFTATFVTDSSVPGATSLVGPTSRTLSGPGVVSASLTINGHTVVMGGTSGSQALSDNGIVQTAAHAAGRFDESLNYYEDPEFGLMLYGYRYSANLGLSMLGIGDGDINTLPPGMIGTGSFYEYIDSFSGFVGASGDSGADLLITSYSSTYQAIPEPQTWALLIVGFGATGQMLRRRRGHRFAPA